MSRAEGGGVGQSAAQVAAAVTAGVASGALALQSRTPAAGIGFINGTQNFLTWTTPNDGQLHSIQVIGYVGIITANTGGAAQVTSTINGVGQTTSVDNGGAQGGGTYNQISVRLVVDPGSTVTLQQNTALTGGQKTMWAAFFVN